MYEEALTIAAYEEHTTEGLPDTLARHTCFLLAKVAQQANEELGRVLKAWDLKTRHYAVLATLEEEWPLSQLEVGRRLRVDGATMVKLVDELANKGMVQRERKPEDRRYYDLKLTDLGHKILLQTRSAVESVDVTILGDLTEEQRAGLEDALARVLQRRL